MKYLYYFIILRILTIYRFIFMIIYLRLVFNINNNDCFDKIKIFIINFIIFIQIYI